jgi:hypothetical protein
MEMLKTHISMETIVDIDCPTFSNLFS